MKNLGNIKYFTGERLALIFLLLIFSALADFLDTSSNTPTYAIVFLTFVASIIDWKFEIYLKNREIRKQEDESV